MIPESRLEQLVDLDRYPVHLPDSSGLKRVIADVRSQLASDGCSVLPGLFAPSCERMSAEASELVPKAYIKERHGNPYSSPDDPTLPERHPVRTFLKRTQGFVAGDLISEDTALKTVYRNADFRCFVARCLGRREIHEYADPLGCLVVNVIKDGCEHPWHFDANEFIVSTLVQSPEGGGAFEYCPDIRSETEENFDRVARVIHGEDRSEVKTLPLKPGDIQVFLGRYALHRVAPVRGPRPRLSVIFAYADQPGHISTPTRARHLFGRTTPLHENQPAQRADYATDGR